MNHHFKFSNWVFRLAFALYVSLLPVGLHAQFGDWYNLDFAQDSVMGVSANKALAYLEGRATLVPVVVAVIDDGVDIYHRDFEGKIWVNAAEMPDDGVDNDGNRFVDDVHGWNFLGNPQGENIEFETLELTRLLRKMAPSFDGKELSDFKGKEKKEFQRYKSLMAIYDEDVQAAQDEFAQFSQLAALYGGAMAFAREKLDTEELSVQDLLNYTPEDEEERQVIDFLLMAEQQGLREYLDQGSAHFDKLLNYYYNFDFDPRPLVNEGDEVPYGNPMVWAANPDHGTHVAGIIGAVRDNGFGVNGIAPNAIILPVRAVPGGDERDKDVAAAIRYAVDQGARIINMSFGKPYSPDEPLVREAIAYARARDVLMVHAAGNDASNNDQVPNYPDGTLGKRKSLDNWITVAASGPFAGDELLAEFSNYGKRKVDVLAPGVAIESLAPGDGVATNSGTSMAAPVVSGVAALIRGLNPELSAKEVKDILIRTAQMLPDNPVLDEDGSSPLKKKVRNPGVVSAYEAVKFTEAERSR